MKKNLHKLTVVIIFILSLLLINLVYKNRREIELLKHEVGSDNLVEFEIKAIEIDLEQNRSILQNKKEIEKLED